MVGTLEDGDSFELEVSSYIEECRKEHNCGYDTAAYVLGLLTYSYEQKGRTQKLLRSNDEVPKEVVQLR